MRLFIVLTVVSWVALATAEDPSVNVRDRRVRAEAVRLAVAPFPANDEVASTAEKRLAVDPRLVRFAPRQWGDDYFYGGWDTPGYWNGGWNGDWGYWGPYGYPRRQRVRVRVSQDVTTTEAPADEVVVAQVM